MSLHLDEVHGADLAMLVLDPEQPNKDTANADGEQPPSPPTPNPLLTGDFLDDKGLGTPVIVTQ